MATDTPTPCDINAAGGVVCRRQGADWEVAIVGSSEPIEWRLPKGLCEEGESIVATAAREVLEETGLLVRVGPELGAARWTYDYSGKRYQKTTTFFLMFYNAGSLEDRGAEYPEAAWVDLSTALTLLRFDSEKEILRKAAELLTIASTPSP